ncbi:DUF1501 domain-containing protein [Nocardioides euryhalodurans]|uniref:DUF1501 domain-containing protein n=1 Tax=Nocardioides euryhalodurans TaxID=2518370 RepID=A0A4P7GH85_9ACTN|nr:DUF1501 domain-containing protein [Nocardioides euryhalodurans]QBR91248.1 DUF1501 domain-containing protein [Nocardioides euryhalodurans]
MTPDACCPEFAAVSRRGLFAGAAALVGTTTAFGSAVLTASAAHAASADAVLVVVSLRGAADGMSLVVPHGDPVYYQARPRIAVDSEKLLAKDGFFGLHPALAPLLPWWISGAMAAIHATGLPSPNRSHFSAMEEVEDADPGSSARVGWLNRLVGADAIDSPLQAFGVGSGTPPGSLVGPAPYLTGDSVDDVRVPGADHESFAPQRMRSLHTLWDRNGHPLAGTMRSVFRADADFAPVRRTSPNPANGARYDGDLGKALQAAARVVKGDVGVQVLTVDHGDWDHHTDIGTLSWGQMLRQAGNLATNVDAFLTDLGALREKVTVVVLSEFGRRVKENANMGLDHGYGNVMFVLGAGVRGGQFYGSWPDLTAEVDSDLTVTTDYRAVLWDIVSARFAVSPAAVFPRFTPAESLGFMRSG